MERFGELVKEKIEQKNMTQREVAHKLNISPQTMSALVNNRKKPNIQVFLDIIELLDLRKYYFYRNEPYNLDLDKWIKNHTEYLSLEQKSVITVIMQMFIDSNT